MGHYPTASIPQCGGTKNPAEAGRNASAYKARLGDAPEQVVAIEQQIGLRFPVKPAGHVAAIKSHTLAASAAMFSARSE